MTFAASGISTAGKPVAGVAGFVEFDTVSKTANCVKKETGAFDWSVTKIKSKTTGIGKAVTTAPVTVYTVLDVPKDPWNPADGEDSVPNSTCTSYVKTTDNKMQPWKTVLETLTQANWCGGKTAFLDAAAVVTTNLNNRFNYQDWTGTEYYKIIQVPNSPFRYFNISNFHAVAKDTNGGRGMANCLDMAWGVVMFSNILGDNLKVMNITSPFGFTTRKILPIGRSITAASDWVSMNWSYHAVAVRPVTNSIYDACLMLDESSPVLPINMSWTTYSAKLTASTVDLVANTRPIDALR